MSYRVRICVKSFFVSDVFILMNKYTVIISLASEGAVKRPLISIWNKDGVQDGAWTDNWEEISCAVEETCGQLAATENAAGEQGVCALQYYKWKSVKDKELRSEGVGDSGKCLMNLTIPMKILNSWKLLMFSFAAFLQWMWRAESLILCKNMRRLFTSKWPHLQLFW